MRLALASALLAVVVNLSAVAAVPTKVSYQGYLTSGGVPVNTTVNMTVKLYDALTNGNLIWSETQSVAVANGVYSVVLGNTNPLDENIFTGQVYLTVAAGGDGDMAPRTLLTSAPYAIRAKVLDGTLGVAGGGTGATTLGQGRLLYGQGASAIGALANNPGGKILVSGQTPNDPPVWSAITASFDDLGLPAGRAIYIDGLAVLGSRQPGVANAVDATGVVVGDSPALCTVAEMNALVARLNELLARLRNHGLIEP